MTKTQVSIVKSCNAIIPECPSGPLGLLSPFCAFLRFTIRNTRTRMGCTNTSTNTSADNTSKSHLNPKETHFPE